MHKGGSVAVVELVSAVRRLISLIPSCLGSSPAVATRRSGRNLSMTDEEADETRSPDLLLLLLLLSPIVAVAAIDCFVSCSSLVPRNDPMAINDDDDDATTPLCYVSSLFM